MYRGGGGTDDNVRVGGAMLDKHYEPSVRSPFSCEVVHHYIQKKMFTIPSKKKCFACMKTGSFAEKHYLCTGR